MDPVARQDGVVVGKVVHPQAPVLEALEHPDGHAVQIEDIHDARDRIVDLGEARARERHVERAVVGRPRL